VHKSSCNHTQTQTWVSNSACVKACCRYANMPLSLRASERERDRRVALRSAVRVLNMYEIMPDELTINGNAAARMYWYSNVTLGWDRSTMCCSACGTSALVRKRACFFGIMCLGSGCARCLRGPCSLRSLSCCCCRSGQLQRYARIWASREQSFKHTFALEHALEGGRRRDYTVGLRSYSQM